MIKFFKPRSKFYDLKSKIFIIDFEFFTWTFSIMYDSQIGWTELIASKIFNTYKKVVNLNSELKIYFKHLQELIEERKNNFKIFSVEKLKTKLVSKANWFLKYFTVPYKIKTSKRSKFSFKYMWSNIWSITSFFFSSFSKLRYAWMFLKTKRSNYFGSFYYTGATHKFKVPDNLSELNSDHNPHFVKIAPKKNQKIPYKLHPYVRYSTSPYCYVAATCSSGILGFRKKNKRSKDVFNTIKNYFSVFFSYYFSFYKIDFLFFRLNGVYKIFKFFKKQFFKQFKDNFYNLKKLYKKSLTLKKTIQIYDSNRDAYPSLLTNLVALMGGHDITKPIPEDLETKEYLSKSMSESDTKFNVKKSRLRRMLMKILYHLSKFPKFIYILDTTTYPFNGCRRVRHYKK